MRKIASLLALASLAALTACDWGKKKEDEALPLNETENVFEVNEVEAQPEPAPPADMSVNMANAAMPAAPPPPPVTEDQQTLDDADATGLTSRLPELDDVAGNAGQ